mmetsp:Transcript_22232/g.48502  ORF Transcript_22232/g.48502 Transcript_22232/m.48502 type:complete len:206 (-) Transcript_22232:81-698(-)
MVRSRLGTTCVIARSISSSVSSVTPLVQQHSRRSVLMTHAPVSVCATSCTHSSDRISRPTIVVHAKTIASARSEDESSSAMPQSALRASRKTRKRYEERSGLTALSRFSTSRIAPRLPYLITAMARMNPHALIRHTHATHNLLIHLHECGPGQSSAVKDVNSNTETMKMVTTNRIRVITLAAAHNGRSSEAKRQRSDSHTSDGIV